MQRERMVSEAGFSLTEVAVAAGIFASALVGLADVFTQAVTAGLAARRTSYASLLAQQKLEELESLAFGLEPDGRPVTDTLSDTAQQPVARAGGTGLAPSPPDTLERDTGGFVDYVHVDGRRTADAAEGAPFVRRWAVTPAPDDAADTLVIQVVVTDRPGRTPSGGTRLAGEARVFTVRTRVAP